jgi:glycosyltransferase involved in cell wall biosynthesis
MTKVSILIPFREHLNSYRGGAIARWIWHVYTCKKPDYHFDILGRIINDEYDFQSADSLTIVSKYNHLLDILTQSPIIRTILKPHITSIYLKIYKKNILSSDILEIHNSIGYVSKIRDLKFSGKIILHMHNDYLNKLSKESLTALSNQVDLLILPSEALKNEFLSIHPEFTQSIGVVHNGYDPKSFFPQKEAMPKQNPTIGYVGRFDKNKNILNLLDIYTVLLKKIPNLEFYLIGSGKSGGIENRYQRLVLKKIDRINSQNGNIKYLGYIHNDQLNKYYNLFDLFISLPVDSEAFGMTFVEALACKTLSIGTNLGGIPEAIGCTELLINNPRDHAEVTEKIFQILSDESLQKSLVEKTFKYVSTRFQWEAIRAEQFKILKSIV